MCYVKDRLLIKQSFSLILYFGTEIILISIALFNILSFNDFNSSNLHPIL